MHLDVVREAVDADRRQVHARRAVDAEREVEIDGGGVEAIEVRVVEVLPAQCGREHGAHVAGFFRLVQHVDRRVHVLQRHHGGGEEPAAALLAVVADEAVVEPRESDGEGGVLIARHAERETREQHHLVDALAIRVGDDARGRVRIVRLLGEPVLRRAARARPVRLGIARALRW